MAGLSLYLYFLAPVESQGARNKEPGEVAQNCEKGNNAGLRSGTQGWAQTPGEQGPEGLWAFSLVATLWVRDPGAHALGQEGEMRSAREILS